MIKIKMFVLSFPVHSSLDFFAPVVGWNLPTRLLLDFHKGSLVYG